MDISEQYVEEYEAFGLTYTYKSRNKELDDKLVLLKRKTKRTNCMRFTEA